MRGRGRYSAFFYRVLFFFVGRSVLFSASDSRSVLFLMQNSRFWFFQLFDPKVHFLFSFVCIVCFVSLFARSYLYSLHLGPGSLALRSRFFQLFDPKISALQL
ncbi:hypothetical protein GLOIN_2v1486220 [Rhizophagus irregularis DAOM 181602=DAOM 197198]|uniref:Transmembrane protein n=1 Tax=Rhizophagus irregularis (strain DAOM 181602 / DAOM 197198 / MUCL 43194) TaxID=747089 RepID=A0A2P4P7W0_RHIID|nr:hypothetical protein GLOIN_2v1486220 [Rhizophagus irregularis DAOM 181602=DAOM 197198]POG61472.1 hypothetical protein GLOIN_2v1486220 [Rhizophagus irregularis DAOM 181602=DAOM 197198]|eukprot:XP_025168338.1 hypothetical protein GLOIN_2v1486220 [Rhizophagus irregularis DAOM 181602=DAOM 197198]